MDERAVPELAFSTAEVGDVLLDLATRPIPPGWRELDGAQLLSYEWPEYVAKMGIRLGSFTLPEQQRRVDGMRPLVKLGRYRAKPSRL